MPSTDRPTTAASAVPERFRSTSAPMFGGLPYDQQLRTPRTLETSVAGASYSLNYFWQRRAVGVHVHVELSPRQARDLAASLLYFAKAADAV